MRPIASAVLAAALGLALTAPASAKDAFWAQVTYLKGTASVIPAGSPDPQPLKRGAVLHRGDTVRAAESSQVSLLLSDGGILVVRALSEVVLGRVMPPGPTLKAVASNLSKTLMAREGDNPMLKHLGGLRGSERNLAIAPCRTKVRRENLRLIWVAKPGVATYAVTLMGPDDILTEFSTAQTQVAVPAEKLNGGGVYYWEVRDAASRDSLSVLGSGTFTTLEKKAEDDLRALEASLHAAYPERGEDTTPQFLSLQIYRERGLNLDALRLLNSMAATAPGDPDLLRLRREICEEMGIPEADAAKLPAAP